MSPDQPPDLPTPPDVAAEQQFAEQQAKAAEAAAGSANADVRDGGVLDEARELASAAFETFVASLALVRAEFHLARNSAIFLIVLTCVMLVLAVGAWLGLLALLAVGTARLAGSWPVGIASVVVINVAGGVWVYFMIRRSFRDMGMPRTRRLIAGMRPQQKAPDASAQPSDNTDGVAH